MGFDTGQTGIRASPLREAGSALWDGWERYPAASSPTRRASAEDTTPVGGKGEPSNFSEGGRGAPPSEGAAGKR